MRKGYAPGQLEKVGVDAEKQHRWDAEGWSFEGYRDGPKGEWRITSMTTSDGTNVRYDMRFDSEFSADDVAHAIALQVQWQEEGPPPDDRTDYELLDEKVKKAKAERETAKSNAIRAEILRR
jgi:hypothetical protein